MKVLFGTIGYPPNIVGGTEVYVQGLVEDLCKKGIKVSVICFANITESAGNFHCWESDVNSIKIYNVGINKIKLKKHDWTYEINYRNELTEIFAKVVEKEKPDIVHIHPGSIGLWLGLLKQTKEKEIINIVTFHSSNTTCARFDMVKFGKTDCDGFIDQKTCTVCLMNSRGVHKLIGNILSILPEKINYLLSSILNLVPRIGGKLCTLFRMKKVVSNQKNDWDNSLKFVDAMVAVCDWVEHCAFINGVDKGKIYKSRHGLRIRPKIVKNVKKGPIKFGYIGRLSREKGIDLLMEAFRDIPKDLDFSLEICSSTFLDENNIYVKKLQQMSGIDNRIVCRGKIEDDNLEFILSDWDALIVPSIWFESGPQVVYEAFSVQTPVIGSQRGGISELVIEGETGFLFKPGNVFQLKNIIIDCILNPVKLRELRGNIPLQRSVANVGDDMIQLYRKLCH